MCALPELNLANHRDKGLHNRQLLAGHIRDAFLAVKIAVKPLFKLFNTTSNVFN